MTSIFIAHQAAKTSVFIAHQAANGSIRWHATHRPFRIPKLSLRDALEFRSHGGRAVSITRGSSGWVAQTHRFTDREE